MPGRILRSAGLALVARANAQRWLTGAIGAALAIAATGLIAASLGAATAPGAWLVASMGASAVLLFVLPASPLSQPWPVFGGHVLAAAIGLVVRAIVPEPWLAAGIAVGAAIVLMNLARCLHPPAGGTVLITTLATPAALTWSFLVFPLALNVLVLLIWAVGWNRLTGHSYPHRTPPVAEQRTWVGHIDDADLDAVLAEWNDVLDISREDLLGVLHAAEARVFARTNPRQR
ncbi:HPP family protein [Novosphingobium aquiterrae]|uniref:HPP family protein n=1 Tax=Novosphingobium aquiterrae TaxID=624388 RepID=A0ABV6PJ31_9SPHN